MGLIKIRIFEIYQQIIIMFTHFNSHRGGAGDGPGGNCGGGGGGGYTKTIYGIKVTPGETILYSIGKGGTSTYNGDGNAGGSTSFSSYTVNGGQGGQRYNNGGNGGSGGGGRFGGGGSDGGNGAATNGIAGEGQHETTRCPFNNILYSGGGASGSSGYTIYPGGSGGGANSSGGYIGHNEPQPNTGGGGSGFDATDGIGTSGADGIIILKLYIKT